MGTAFRWNPSYSVQIAQFDEQHQQLFRTINELHQALGAGLGNGVVGDILQRLIEHTVTHFAAEEAAMEKSSFPGLSAHRAEHKAMAERVLKFQQDFKAGKVGVPTALMLYLDEWLHHHILETDKAYGPFLNEKGIY
jgi:hemerythrin